MTETKAPQAQPPEIGRRTLTPLGYAIVAIVPILVAAVAFAIVVVNYDPEDVVTGTRVPIMTSDWRPGDASGSETIEGELTLGQDECVHVVASDGSEVDVVWPFDYEATYDAGNTGPRLKLYDTDRKIAARGGDTIRLRGELGDVGEYAGRPCAPDSGQVAFAQSEVVVTARG